MGVLRRIPGFRSGTRARSRSSLVFIHLLLIGSCLSVLACGGDEKSDSASGAPPTARVEATATPLLLAIIAATPEPTATPVRYATGYSFSCANGCPITQALSNFQAYCCSITNTLSFAHCCYSIATSQYLPHRRRANSIRNSTLAKGTSITAETLSSSGRLKRYWMPIVQTQTSSIEMKTAPPARASNE